MVRLLLKTSPTLTAERRPLSWELTRKFSTQQLAFIELKCAMQAAGGEKGHWWYYLAWNPPCYNTNLLDKMCPLYNSAKIIYGATNGSLDWIWRLFYKRKFMSGPINMVKTNGHWSHSPREKLDAVLLNWCQNAIQVLIHRLELLIIDSRWSHAYIIGLQCSQTRVEKLLTAMGGG